MLYHLSIDCDLSYLEPRIPECAIPKFEDVVTKRICFSDSISGCLSALQGDFNDYFVYVLDEELTDDEIYHPSEYDVRDCKYTNEVWVTRDVKVKCIGKIEVCECVKTEKYKTVKGDVTVFFYTYKWVYGPNVY